MSVFDQAVGTTGFRNDPYPTYHAVRAADPVHWSEAWGCWVLTRHADVVATLQDPETFSSRGRVTNVIERTYPSAFLQQTRPLLDHFKQGLINADPPDHTRLRRLIQKTFLPRTLERLRPRVESVVNDLLDAIPPEAEADLVRDLTHPLPVIVIAELLGVPREMRDQFKRWSAEILEFQAVPRADPAVVLRSQTALLECRSYLRTVVEERRRSPREDLLSDLARVEEAGDCLSEEELMSTGVALLVAGHETTTNLIASALYLLLRHPEELARLRTHPELLPAAIEETLRFESPLQRVGRTATRDVRIGERQIRRGDSVLALLGAANRDPEAFPEPDRFDIGRSPNRHVAFGSGPHFCIGAALARLEAPIALAAVRRRWPDLRLGTGPFEWNSGVMRGLRSLPVIISAAS